MEDCQELKAQIEKKGLYFKSVRPISVKEVETKIKTIRENIINQDLVQFGHITDKQIKEALGIFLHDNNFFINKGGAKNKISKKRRHKKSRKHKQSRRQKQTIRQTI